MLPQSERLSRPLISELLKAGRRYSDALFDVRYMPAESFKATIIISKKVAPLSVGRHLLKRRMNAALLAKKTSLPRIHVACILKKSANPPSVDDYKNALSEFIRKVLSKGV